MTAWTTPIIAVLMVIATTLKVVMSVSVMMASLEGHVLVCVLSVKIHIILFFNNNFM